MDRLSEIRAQFEEAKADNARGYMIPTADVEYLLAEIERIKTQCDINATSFFDMRDQLKKAEAERDTYREALQNWHEREGEQG